MQTKSCQNLSQILGPLTPFMLVMIGAPGSGKSTVVTELLKNHKIIIGSTDDLIQQQADLLNSTYSKVFKSLDFGALNKQMMKSISGAVEAAANIAVDRTNMSAKSRRPFVQMAKANDYNLIALNFIVDEQVLYERLARRGDLTGKIIPDFVVKNMLNNYETPSPDEGFDFIFKMEF